MFLIFSGYIKSGEIIAGDFPFKSVGAIAPSQPAVPGRGPAPQKLRLGLLTALVIGSMIGSGILRCCRTWPTGLGRVPFLSAG